MAAASNTQSKSASVISNCKRCKNKVVHGVKCAECLSNYHVSCAKLLNNINFLSDDTISCCASVGECDTAFFDAVEALGGAEKKVDVAIFNYIIKQKDVIINDLREQIISLNKYIETLKSTTVIRQKVLDEKDDKPVVERKNSYLTKNNNINSKPLTSKQMTNADVNIGCLGKETITIQSAHVAAALNEAETRIKCNEYINLAQDNTPITNSKSEGEWKKIVSGKRRKGTLVVGNSTESNFVKLKGIPKTVALHVYRVEPNTNEESLKTFLKINFPEVVCELIQSRHPDIYSSFKVTIYEDNLDKAMDPMKWPRNACVRRFLDLGRKTEPTSRR